MTNDKTISKPKAWESRLSIGNALLGILDDYVVGATFDDRGRADQR